MTLDSSSMWDPEARVYRVTFPSVGSGSGLNNEALQALHSLIVALSVPEGTLAKHWLAGALEEVQDAIKWNDKAIKRELRKLNPPANFSQQPTPTNSI